MEITARLSEFCAGVSVATLPPAVTARTRLLLLDLVGNIVRARHDAESTPALLATARALGFTGGTARVFADAHGYTDYGLQTTDHRSSARR